MRTSLVRDRAAARHSRSPVGAPDGRLERGEPSTHRIAIIDADEPDHGVCVATLDDLALPLVSTWPAFTEAMYLIGRAGEITGQRALWKLVHTGRLVIADLSPHALDRSAALMDRYSDRPMDLADATLVAHAEELGQRKIFTLDSNFHIYRIRGRQRFDVVPAP